MSHGPQQDLEFLFMPYFGLTDGHLTAADPVLQLLMTLFYTNMGQKCWDNKKFLHRVLFFLNLCKKLVHILFRA